MALISSRDGKPIGSSGYTEKKPKSAFGAFLDKVVPDAVEKKVDSFSNTGLEIGGNFVNDLKDAATGLLPALEEAGEMVLQGKGEQLLNNVWDGFKQGATYKAVAAPFSEEITGKDAWEAFKAHPLDPTLDLASLFTGGSTLAAKSAVKAADAGKVNLPAKLAYKTEKVDGVDEFVYKAFDNPEAEANLKRISQDPTVGVANRFQARRATDKDARSLNSVDQLKLHWDKKISDREKGGESVDTSPELRNLKEERAALDIDNSLATDLKIGVDDATGSYLDSYIKGSPERKGRQIKTGVKDKETGKYLTDVEQSPDAGFFKPVPLSPIKRPGAALFEAISGKVSPNAPIIHNMSNEKRAGRANRKENVRNANRSEQAMQQAMLAQTMKFAEEHPDLAEAPAFMHQLGSVENLDNLIELQEYIVKTHDSNQASGVKTGAAAAPTKSVLDADGNEIIAGADGLVVRDAAGAALRDVGVDAAGNVVPGKLGEATKLKRDEVLKQLANKPKLDEKDFKKLIAQLEVSDIEQIKIDLKLFKLIKKEAAENSLTYQQMMNLAKMTRDYQARLEVKAIAASKALKYDEDIIINGGSEVEKLLGIDTAADRVMMYPLNMRRAVKGDLTKHKLGQITTNQSVTALYKQGNQVVNMALSRASRDPQSFMEIMHAMERSIAAPIRRLELVKKEMITISRYDWENKVNQKDYVVVSKISNLPGFESLQRLLNDPKTVQNSPTMEALKLSLDEWTKLGEDGTKVSVIPKKTWNELIQPFNGQSSHAANFDKLTRGWTIGVLAARPAWALNQILSNPILYLAHFGPKALLDYSFNPDKRLFDLINGDEELALKMAGTYGEVDTAAYYNDIGAISRVDNTDIDSKQLVKKSGQIAKRGFVNYIGFVNMLNRKFADDLTRKNALYHKLKQAGNDVIADHKARTGRDMDMQTAMKTVFENEAKLDAIIDDILDGLGDFSADALTPFERNVVRKLLPFFAWQKNITRISYNHLVNEPWLVLAASYLNDATEEERAKELGIKDHSGLSRSLVGDGLGIPGMNSFNTQAINPYAGVGGMLATAASIVPGTGVYGGDAQPFLAQTNPLIKVPIEALSRRNLDTGAQLTTVEEDKSVGRLLAERSINSVPFSRILNPIDPGSDLSVSTVGAQPGSNYVFERGLDNAALNYLGLPTENVNQEVLQQMGAKELARREKRIENLYK